MAGETFTPDLTKIWGGGDKNLVHPKTSNPLKSAGKNFHWQKGRLRL